ncbi:MAG: hypothetical protein P4M15_11065 [Alphaproteobacteria bacterium]|nr:hypothetical protein [Alphaproteobacteria bacterium]
MNDMTPMRIDPVEAERMRKSGALPTLVTVGGMLYAIPDIAGAMPYGAEVIGADTPLTAEEKSRADAIAMISNRLGMEPGLVAHQLDVMGQTKATTIISEMNSGEDWQQRDALSQFNGLSSKADEHRKRREEREQREAQENTANLFGIGIGAVSVPLGWGIVAAMPAALVAAAQSGWGNLTVMVPSLVMTAGNTARNKLRRLQAAGYDVAETFGHNMADAVRHVVMPAAYRLATYENDR